MEGSRSRGRPKKCWLSKTYQNRNEWRKRVRTATHTHAGRVMMLIVKTK